MEWCQLLSRNRFGSDGTDHTEIGRSDFHRDSDRIIFSSSFRRLGKKTQVHPLAKNDHVHTRLTHSMEVASVGRSLGFLVGNKIHDQLPEGVRPENVGEIVQAACLAHDVGNPPFGHAGEDAISSWFRQVEANEFIENLDENQRDDLLNYEGNAQGFRVCTRLEYYKNEGGMRLTNATLGAMMKYPWTSLESKRNKKFGAFQADRENLEIIATALGLIKRDSYYYCRHPLAFLSEAADDICYRILDIEDAHEMKLLSFDDIIEILQPLCVSDSNYKQIIDDKNISNRRKVAYLRGKSIGAIVYSAADVFNQSAPGILNGTMTTSLIDLLPKEYKEPLTRAKWIARERIFKEPRKVELEIGAYSTMSILLKTLCKAVKEQVQGQKLSFKSKRVLDMMGYNAPKKGDDLYMSYLAVLDYISGMTDNYATYLAKQFSGDGN